MARLARIVFPGCPHHVTQRGNRRQEVFRDNEDRFEFVDMLAAETQRAGVRILAYTLMTNHIHLIAVPESQESLSVAMRRCLSDYARAFNRRCGYTGHLWQARFYSSALAPQYLWNAVRYVERNPVRARMVLRAEDYPWSSAEYHCGLRDTDALVSPASPFKGALADWSAWLHKPDDDRNLNFLRRNTRTGRPSGSKEFISMLEYVLGRRIYPRKRGADRNKRTRASKAKKNENSSLS